MTASYSGNPASSNLDAIRCLIGDVGVGGTWYLQDEEIDYFDGRTAVAYNDTIMSAAICADVLAGRFAAEIAISADGVSVGADALQSKFEQMSVALRRTYKQLAVAGGSPYAGGIDLFQVVDPGTRPLSFGIGMDDNFRAGGQEFGDRGEFANADWTGDWMDSAPW